jgi:uncharacterized protein
LRWSALGELANSNSGVCILVTNSITHFEIYGEQPVGLADFYRKVFNWQVEQMPGVDYWRIQTGSSEGKPLHGNR